MRGKGSRQHDQIPRLNALLRLRKIMHTHLRLGGSSPLKRAAIIGERALLGARIDGLSRRGTIQIRNGHRRPGVANLLSGGRVPNVMGAILHQNDGPVLPTGMDSRPNPARSERSLRMATMFSTGLKSPPRQTVPAVTDTNSRSQLGPREMSITKSQKMIMTTHLHPRRYTEGARK